MATIEYVYHFTFADADGNIGHCNIRTFNVDTQLASDMRAISDSLNVALAPLSNAKIVNRSVTVQFDRAQGIGVDAEFPGIEDKAKLTFTNALGSKGAISVPAPKEVIFLPPPADDVVNMANALVIAFHTQWTTDVFDASQTSINLLTSGTRRVGRFPKLQPRRTATA